MMDEKSMVTLKGYEFKLTEYVYANGTTTIEVYISGNGQADNDMVSWVLESCMDGSGCRDDGINILSCEKRTDGGVWVPAAAQMTVHELTDDIGVNGVLIEEGVGKGADDTGVAFRLLFDGEIRQEQVKVAYITGDTVYRSKDHIEFSDSQTEVKHWHTPIEKAFCLYIVVPEGYRPVSACKTNISILKRGLFITHENTVVDIDGNTEDGVPLKAEIMGTIKIIASVPLKSHQACGDSVYATSCDCFELCETIGYTDALKKYNMRDISVCLKKKSLDLTLLNAHCGKSVYRLDGEYVLNCKACATV